MPTRKTSTVLCVLSLSAMSACIGADEAMTDGFAPEAISAAIVGGAGARPLKLNHHGVSLNWGITKAQEEACGAPPVAGAEAGGGANFTHLGITTTAFSAAWDIGHLLTTPAQFTPVGPASGPVAPVLGQNAYPYAFKHNPATGGCGGGVSATGKVVITAADGDKVFGDIVGGETHKLDFIVDGDGVEVFAQTVVTGGTGRFANATGSFVLHTIGRLGSSLKFDITMVEVLPGGTLGF